MVQQLALNLSLQDELSFSNFIEGENSFVISSLADFVKVADNRFIYLLGLEGSGKTHLLQAVCHEASENNKQVFYLPLQEFKDYGPGILEGLADLDIIAIDDIHCIVGNNIWEEALFHTFNKLKDSTHTLLIVSSVRAPNVLGLQLKDLNSRLNSGLTLKLKLLSDPDKIKAIVERANNRGLELPTEVAQFILKHYPRSMQRLFDALDILDKASLQHQRRLTIPFTKQILGI